MSLALVRYVPPPTKALQSRLILLAELKEQLEELEARHQQETTGLREFEKRFRPAVGDRYDQLEEMREKIRRAWTEVNEARNGAPRDSDADRDPDEIPQEAFRPEDEVRKLFRQLARKIHPDLGEDYEERQRRHEFMAEATRAYRAGDHRRLQWLLEHWEASPRLPQGVDVPSRLARTNEHIAWVRYRIQELNAAIAELGASSQAELMRQAEDARRTGRNLVAEMRKQVLQELQEAHADLEKVEAVIADLDEETVKIVRAGAGLD